MSDLTVTTWADGFGTWHARVQRERGWGNVGADSLDAHWANLRRRARLAIRAEIEARESGPIGPVRIEVEQVNDPTGTGWITSVVFVEKGLNR
jgi:hypothetical protein